MKIKHLIITTTIAICTGFGVLPSFAEVNTQLVQGIAPIVEQVSPAIVNIMVERKLSLKTIEKAKKKHRSPSDMITLGSGFIFDQKNGMIITNAHVVKHAKYIFVSLKDGRRFRAKLIGADDGFDIGVIQIHADQLQQLPFADSNKLKVGDFVAAIGSPFGLEGSVTYGIISALDRSQPKIEGYQSFIQTDAPINPGNSGGPLINLQGEVIGINTALVGPGANAGIGFSIPSNMAKNLTEQLIQYGKIKHGLLGILAQAITKPLADTMHLDKDTGVIVSDVIPGSPAEKAGLEPKDIIVSIDNNPMDNPVEVRNALGMIRPGTSIKLQIIRNKKPQTITAVVGDPDKQPQINKNGFLAGLTLRNFDELEANGTELSGVLVANVAPTSQGALAGLTAGDVITQVDGTLTRNIKDIAKATKTHTSSILLNVNRDNVNVFLVIDQAI